MTRMRVVAALFLSVVGLTTIATAQPKSLGQFEDHADIGAPRIAGDAVFDASTHQYQLSAGGANMFHDHDEFHFVWRKVSGNFIIGARVKFVGQGVEAHRKAGLMARSSLDAGAAYVDAVVHGQGPTALQTRRSNGADTEMLVTAGPSDPAPKILGTPTPDADYVQLERRDRTYTVTIVRYGQPATQQKIDSIDLGSAIYVGLFLCAHDPDVKEEAIFSEVEKAAP